MKVKTCTEISSLISKKKQSFKLLLFIEMPPKVAFLVEMPIKGLINKNAMEKKKY